MGSQRKTAWGRMLVTSFLVLCSFCSPLAKGDVNFVELAKKVRPAVVLIETFDKDKNPLGQSSGFFVNQNGHLIMNHHVIEGAYSATIKTLVGLEIRV